MTARTAVLAVAVLVAAPSAAQAAPCQPGPQHPTLQAHFEDITLSEVISGPPTVHVGHRLGVDGQFPDAGTSGRDGVIPGSLQISAPADVPVTSHSDGHQLALIPQAAGTIPITFTWLESRSPADPNPVTSCQGTTSVDVTVVRSVPATIQLRTVRAKSRPRLDLRFGLGFAENGDASPITMRARQVAGTTPPNTGLKRIASLNIDAVSKGLHKRVGSHAELFYKASPSGGDATIRWSGAHSGALSVDLVQRGKTRARLRTRVVCNRKSCRAVGLRFTKP